MLVYMLLKLASIVAELALPQSGLAGNFDWHSPFTVNLNIIYLSFKGVHVVVMDLFDIALFVRNTIEILKGSCAL